MKLRPALTCLILGAAMPGMPALAQEAEIGKAVSVELNAVKAAENGCTLTFLIINGHDSQIEKAVYETVLFDAEGQVDRLTLFDFGALPPARPRVRQFTVPGLACEGLGRILFNGAATCEAPDLDPAACEAGLVTESRTDIEVQG